MNAGETHRKWIRGRKENAKEKGTRGRKVVKAKDESGNKGFSIYKKIMPTV